MSTEMFFSAIVLEELGHDARPVVDADDVHARLALVVRDAADDDALRASCLRWSPIVPGWSLNELRTWTGTPYFIAISTLRIWSTLAPSDASSSISS